MSTKIIEKIIEPSRVEIGSIFKLKIKAIKYLTYNELKTKSYSYYKNNNITYNDLKGE